ncbi:MAG: DNA mismatch endonuclease Vsr [Planctomycetaceae bacterium]
MTDVHSPEQRSWNMSRIRAKDTRPELIVRSIVHRMGYRFRLHRRDLAGKPDLVLPRHNSIIFVHGCFWHMHSCRFGRVAPKTNAEFWQTKRSGNVHRDRRNLRELRKAGWKVLVVWECWTKGDLNKLAAKLERFLETSQTGMSVPPVGEAPA